MEKEHINNEFNKLADNYKYDIMVNISNAIINFMNEHSLDMDEMCEILDVDYEKLDTIINKKGDFNVGLNFTAKLKILTNNKFKLPHFDADKNNNKIIDYYVNSKRIAHTYEDKMNLIMNLLGFNNIDEMVDAARNIHDMNKMEENNNNREDKSGCECKNNEGKCKNDDNTENKHKCNCDSKCNKKEESEKKDIDGIKCKYSKNFDSDGVNGFIKKYDIDASKVTPESIEKLLKNIFDY